MSNFEKQISTFSSGPERGPNYIQIQSQLIDSKASFCCFPFVKQIIVKTKMEDNSEWKMTKTVDGYKFEDGRKWKKIKMEDNKNKNEQIKNAQNGRNSNI